MNKYFVSEFAVINNPKPVRTRELTSILFDIKNGRYQQKVNACRSAIDKDGLECAKRKLPLFTPTGIFSYRSMSGMQLYNGFICLDIDHVDKPDELKEKCKNIPYIYSAFITPSGNGLKVLIKTDATPETYKETELRVSSDFANLTGAVRDNHCKDIARIQYVSYDSELYLNEKSEIFSKTSN